MKFTMKKNIFSALIKTLILAGVFAAAVPVFSHGMDEGHINQFREGSPLDFILIGAIHMVTGYDHILFLVGVIFFLTTVKDILKFITAFTLGHSITLIGATFLGLQMNYYLIDAVIGFSVLYKGFENLNGFKKFFNTESPNLLLVVFLFGLIHGFGLSTRLQSLELGNALNLPSIISFNIGVELGQIAALIPILLLINLFRKSNAFAPFEKAANGFLVFAGAALIVFQMHGFFTSPAGGSYQAVEENISADQLIAEPKAEEAPEVKPADTHKAHSHGGSTHHH